MTKQIFELHSVLYENFKDLFTGMTRYFFQKVRDY